MPEISNFESIGKIENIPSSTSERPDLNLEKKEITDEKKVEKISETPKTVIAPQAIASPSVVLSFEERGKQIENFLARDLEDIYLAMPLEKQVEFRKAGEETATKINKLMEKTKIKMNKIVDLIKKWLLIIPGINRFFLEQETKIKTDQIMKLKKWD